MEKLENFLRLAAPALLTLLGVVMIAVGAVLAFEGHDGSAITFVILGAGLAFVGTFANRLEGDLTLTKDGVTATLAKAAETRIDSRAAEENISPEDVEVAKFVSARDAELYANVTLAESPNPDLVTRLARHYRSNASTAGTATAIADNALDEVLAPNTPKSDLEQLYKLLEKRRAGRKYGDPSKLLTPRSDGVPTKSDETGS